MTFPSFRKSLRGQGFSLFPFARDPWLLIVVVSFAFFAWASWGKVQYPIIDVGREVEIPARLLIGQVLYRDVETYYGPLSYYLNALALFLFGHHLEVFFAIGIGISLCSTIFIYRLTQKLTTSSWAALSAISFTMYCALGAGLFNFILPYSYGGVYATLFCLLSLHCFSSYCQSRNIYWLIASAVLAALAGLSKQEYGISVLGGIIVGIVLIFELSLRARVLKIILVTLVSGITAILPLALIGTQVSWSKLLESLFPASKLTALSNAPIFQNTPSDALLNSWLSFKVFFVSSLMIFVGVIIAHWILQRLQVRFSDSFISFFEVVIGFLIAQLLLTIVGGVVVRSDPASIFKPLRELGWFPYILLGSSIFYAIRLRNYQVNPLLGSLICFALLVNARWSLYVKFYGLYAPVVNLLFFVLLYHAFQFVCRKTIWTYLLICLLVSVHPILTEFASYRYPVNSPYGTFRVKNENLALALEQSINVINSSRESSVLVLPEGNIINFLTRTHSPSREVTFLPHTLLTAHDQVDFISRMQSKIPRIIVYVDRNFKEWGYDSYVDFNPLVHNWIINNYYLAYVFQKDDGVIRIYKLLKKL